MGLATCFGVSEDQDSEDLLHIKVKANTTRRLERINLRFEAPVLGRVASRHTLVCLRARVCGSSACYFPLVWPVACKGCQRLQSRFVARLTVDITTNTCVTTDGLSVLAPKTIGRLGIDKTVRVHNGCDVEVELIDKRLDARV